jgi:Protein of unknown function (DUF3619)
MTHATTFITQDQFAKSLIERLNTQADSISPDTAERLRFAREHALGSQKLSTQKSAELSTAWSLAPQAGGSMALGGGNFNFFNKLGMFLPLLVLIVGLIAINQLQNEYRAKEVADVDAALLTDDLPPAAYADQGFGQFLKLQTEQ